MDSIVCQAANELMKHTFPFWENCTFSEFCLLGESGQYHKNGGKVASHGASGSISWKPSSWEYWCTVDKPSQVGIFVSQKILPQPFHSPSFLLRPPLAVHHPVAALQPVPAPALQLPPRGLRWNADNGRSGKRSAKWKNENLMDSYWINQFGFPWTAVNFVSFCWFWKMNEDKFAHEPISDGAAVWRCWDEVSLQDNGMTKQTVCGWILQTRSIFFSIQGFRAAKLFRFLKVWPQRTKSRARAASFVLQSFRRAGC